MFCYLLIIVGLCFVCLSICQFWNMMKQNVFFFFFSSEIGSNRFFLVEKKQTSWRRQKPKQMKKIRQNLLTNAKVFIKIDKVDCINEAAKKFSVQSKPTFLSFIFSLKLCLKLCGLISPLSLHCTKGIPVSIVTYRN